MSKLQVCVFSLFFCHSKESFIYITWHGWTLMCVPVHRHSASPAKASKVLPDTDQLPWKHMIDLQKRQRGAPWFQDLQQEFSMESIWLGTFDYLGYWLISTYSFTLVVNGVDSGEMYSERRKWSLDPPDGFKVLLLALFSLSSNNLPCGTPVFHWRSGMFYS